MPNMFQNTDEIVNPVLMHTASVQHEPAQMLPKPINSRKTFPWLLISYGLGSDNENLLHLLSSKTWGLEWILRIIFSAFLRRAQGVRSEVERIHFVFDKSSGSNWKLLEGHWITWKKMHRGKRLIFGRPFNQAKHGAYEMAFRMQTSVPEVVGY